MKTKLKPTDIINYIQINVEKKGRKNCQDKYETVGGWFTILFFFIFGIKFMSSMKEEMCTGRQLSRQNTVCKMYCLYNE